MYFPKDGEIIAASVRKITCNMNYGLKSDIELIFSAVEAERGRSLQEIRSGRLYSILFSFETGLHQGRTEPYTKFTAEV
jgi:hypothetical protein